LAIKTTVLTRDRLVDGELVMNRYEAKTRTWTQLHGELIGGEGRRSAHWQIAVDAGATP
jgi:hypothetical protein